MDCCLRRAELTGVRRSTHPAVGGAWQSALTGGEPAAGRPRHVHGAPTRHPAEGTMTPVASSNAWSSNRPSSSTCARVGTSTRTSTRRSRFRCIRSADPIHAWGSPPFSNQKMRLCSRNRPRMLRTVMLSTAWDSWNAARRYHAPRALPVRRRATPGRARRSSPRRPVH